MRKILHIIILIVFTTVFFSNCEKNEQIINSHSFNTNTDENHKFENVQNVNDLVQHSDVITTDVRGNCCNTNFPEYGFTSYTTYEECDGWGDIIYPYLDCALRWATYVTSSNQILEHKACNETTPQNVPNISQLTKSQSGNYPYFSWNFIFCHKYLIQRKIGTGVWSTIRSQENCYDGEGDPSCGATNSHQYTDTGINLSTIQNNVYYRVIAKVYNKQSPNPPQIVYYPQPDVNISGPTQLLTTQTGTFVANVTGGEPPFSYAWQKYQTCEERAVNNSFNDSDNDRSVPCGTWRPIGGNSSTLYASGSIPSFRLKVTVTAQNGSDIDYHLVNVSLP